jgi:hypothetical protein
MLCLGLGRERFPRLILKYPQKSVSSGTSHEVFLSMKFEHESNQTFNSTKFTGNIEDTETS